MNAAPIKDGLRPELTTLPERMRGLPVARGFPVPWFVPKVDGEYDFRVASGERRVRAVKEKLCWVCGQQLGVHKTFAIGPMCAVTRSTSEPACHHECAVWSARNCPFLARPHMVRRENDLPEEASYQSAPGITVTRNPGCTILWTTRTFKTFETHDGNKGWLITVGEPHMLEAYSEGKACGLSVVEESIRTGLHLLEAQCELESTEARKEEARILLRQQVREVHSLLEQYL
jgi:hypothetical protein